MLRTLIALISSTPTLPTASVMPAAAISRRNQSLAGSSDPKLVREVPAKMLAIATAAPFAIHFADPRSDSLAATRPRASGGAASAILRVRIEGEAKPHAGNLLVHSS